METLVLPSDRRRLLRLPALDKVQGTSSFDDGFYIANQCAFSRYTTALSFAII